MIKPFHREYCDQAKSNCSSQSHKRIRRINLDVHMSGYLIYVRSLTICAAHSPLRALTFELSVQECHRGKLCAVSDFLGDINAALLELARCFEEHHMPFPSERARHMACHACVRACRKALKILPRSEIPEQGTAHCQEQRHSGDHHPSFKISHG